MQPAWMVVCGLSCKAVDLDLGTALGGLSVTSGASQHKEQCTARGLRESVTWRGVASRCPRLAQSVRWSKQRGERCWCWCWPCWVLVTAWPMAHGNRMGRSVQCWSGRHGGLNPGCLQETWIFLAQVQPAGRSVTCESAMHCAPLTKMTMQGSREWSHTASCKSLPRCKRGGPGAGQPPPTAAKPASAQLLYL